MKIEEQIAFLLAAYHRKYTDQKQCAKRPCKICLMKYINYIQSFTRLNKKIQFVLPAFPSKSPNPQKTATFLPDLGEVISLKFLNEFCQKINKFYKPGSEIVICSDGRVFNDLLKITNEKVTAYTKNINLLIKTYQLNNLRSYNLEAHYGNLDFKQMRENLICEYGQSIESLKKRLKENESDLRLFNGIHRFVYEDYVTLSQKLSNNQARNLTKKITYQVIQRSNAWSNLIKSVFPEAIRLSIHPQLCGAEKIGINLLKNSTEWGTPWHGVMLNIDNQFYLVKRKFAEALSSKKIIINGHFSHYHYIADSQTSIHLAASTNGISFKRSIK